MAYFDIKDVVFVNKIANCKKCAKPDSATLRVNQLDFRKISAGLPARSNGRRTPRSPSELPYL